jgi:hypothetical protein
MMRQVLGVMLGVLVVSGGLVGAANQDKGNVVSLDGLSSRTPADWKEVATTSQMRYKQFAVPRVGDDKADAELIIFYFGPGGGGTAADNIQRWKGMFQPPQGKSIDDAARVEEFKVGNVKVTYLDIQGTYLFKAKPIDTKAEPRANHRMLAIIFESPKGPYFIRLVGPEKTVAHHKKGFDEWLRNFK